MQPITIVDARMGRGKTSAAIQYMNDHKQDKRFLYVTPYLNEVARICESCEFDQSAPSTGKSKSAELKHLLYQGRNVAATHALFSLMDDEALAVAKERQYTLIMDESIQTINKINVGKTDMRAILETYADEDEDGFLHWRDKKYAGVFRGYKEMADTNSLYHLDTAFLHIMNPKMFRAFNEVIMMTYLFSGQYQRAYLDYFDFDYRVVGVRMDENGFHFSDEPDNPPPIDYSNLIHIVQAPGMNAVGKDRCALSKSWYKNHTYSSKEAIRLRGNLLRFFYKQTASTQENRLWTTFKEFRETLVERKTGRFRNDYLQMNSMATNLYRDKTNLAYMVNRFIDPNIMKFFAAKDIQIDADAFALSSMIQWIWRSAIRDGHPINLYIPSKRMRDLLTGWMEQVSQGGV